MFIEFFINLYMLYIAIVSFVILSFIKLEIYKRYEF